MFVEKKKCKEQQKKEDWGAVCVVNLQTQDIGDSATARSGAAAFRALCGGGVSSCDCLRCGGGAARGRGGRAQEASAPFCTFLRVYNFTIKKN